VGEVTINSLRAIGANVRVEASDLATAFQRRQRFDPPDRGGWNIFHTRSLGLELNNPLTSFALASPCGRNAQGVPNGWFGWACDEQLEGLRAQWTRAPNQEERRRIAGQIQLRAADQFPYIPVGQMFTPVAHRANVRGLIEMPIPVMWNISLA
jgi:peptide/nickel transport system substrate-binding protein